MFDNFRVRLSSLGPLVLRLGLGLGFVTHGWGKLVLLHGGTNPLAKLVGTGWLGTSLGWALGLTEFFGGVFVLIGLLTRFWAAGLSIGMMVALTTAHRADFIEFLRRLGTAVHRLFTSGGEFSAAMQQVKLATAELAWAYLAMAFALFLLGPGAFSVDYVLGLIVRGRKRNAVVGLGMRYPAQTDRPAIPPAPTAGGKGSPAVPAPVPPTPFATSKPATATESAEKFKLP